jgi:hypothetical protein
MGSTPTGGSLTASWPRPQAAAMSSETATTNAPSGLGRLVTVAHSSRRIEPIPWIALNATIGRRD